VITRDLPEVPETDLRMYVGAYNRPSHDRWGWTESPRWYNGQSVSHAYKSGDLGIGLYFSRHMDEGYRENDYRRRYNFYVKAKEDFTPTQSLTVNFGLMDQYGGQFLYWRNLDSALRPPLLQDKDNVRSTRYYLTGLYNTVASEGLLFTLKGMWYHNLWGFEAIHGIGRAESQADDFRFEGLSTLMLDNTHTLTAGVTANLDFVSGDMFEAHTIGGAALYAQDDMRLSRQFGLTLGLRYDYESVGLTTPAGQLNPKIALSYTPADGTVLRASFGRGFRVPSVAEAFIQATVSNLVTVPNRDLRPERSLSYEIGLSQRLGGFGTLDLAGFRSDYDDLIEPGLYVEGQEVQIQWRNVTEARVTGLEVGLNLGFFGGNLQYGIGYTYVYPEDLTQGTILKYRPRHVLATNLLGRVGPLFAGADFRYVSRVEEIDDGLVEVGIIPDGDERVQILVTDVRLGAEFRLWELPLSATLMVNNLFQYNYVELIGNLMPPRTYVLVLSIKP
jgi:iron complex outermembrane receptor protein